jgi:hypothetical protein
VKTRLPAKHLALISLAGAAVLLFLVSQLLISQPLRHEVSAAQAQVRSTQDYLRLSGWPLDFERLSALEREMQKKQATAEQRHDDVLRATTSLFAERIMRLYENPGQFQQQVTRLDYQQEFYRIERKFKEEGIVFDRAVLQMSEDTAGVLTYQLVLQLWVLETALDRLLEHGLQPTVITVSEPGNPAAAPRQAHSLRVLRPREYCLDPEIPTPYLLEFPVRVTVRGEAKALHAFLVAAGDSAAFLAVPRIEARTQAPAGAGAGEEVIADLECSAFYLLQRDVSGVPDKAGSKGNLPPGA